MMYSVCSLTHLPNSIKTMMNKGVEILLARMDSHPYEFLDKPSRWEEFLQPMVKRFTHNHVPFREGAVVSFSFLSNSEVDAVVTKWEGLQGTAFTQAIMAELLLTDGKKGMS